LSASQVEQGGKYVKADDWNPKAVADGNLITGQNPQSSDACVKLVIEKLA
jgi:putative intracellular protease/amidase